MAIVDYFLKINNPAVEGEAMDSVHMGEIEVESWSWGETQEGTAIYAQGIAAGKVTVKDFRFIKRMDKSSPKLLLYCCTGQHIKDIKLTCRKAGTVQQEYYVINFTDSLVSSYQTAGSAQTDIVPREQISLNFSKIQVIYRPQLPDGSLGGLVQGGWDVKQNLDSN